MREGDLGEVGGGEGAVASQLVGDRVDGDRLARALRVAIEERLDGASLCRGSGHEGSREGEDDDEGGGGGAHLD